MKPEIFIYNPHYNSMVGKTFDDFFKGSKIPPKYFFLRNLIKKNKLSILISGNFSSLGDYFKNKITLKLIYFIDKYLFKYIQIYLWVIINGINPFKVNIIFDISRLQKRYFNFIFKLKFRYQIRRVLKCSNYSKFRL